LPYHNRFVIRIQLPECKQKLTVHCRTGVTNLFETESYFLAKIHAKGYQFDIHSLLK